MKQLFTLLAIAISVTLFAQNSDTEKAINYLDKQVKCRVDYIVNPAMQDVLAADVLEASLDINLGNKYNDASIYSRVFLTSDAVSADFESKYVVPTSSEFVAALNPEFRLKTEEDGIKLRSLFFKFDDESRSEFFKAGDIWYFIRSEFFGDLSVYAVTVDQEGRILDIESKNLETEKPEIVLGSGLNIRFSKAPKVPIARRMEIQYKLKQDANYTVLLEPVEHENLTVTLYSGEIKETYLSLDGTTSSSTHSFMMLGKDDTFTFINSKSELFDNQDFSENVSTNFRLSSEAEAQLFQDFIGQFLRTDEAYKKFYKSDDIWVFVCEKSFGDLEGLMVSVDESGAIKHFYTGQIDDENKLILRMKDENYVVDYAFKLEVPTTTKHTMSKNESLKVEISFNENPVNAAGAWILTRTNGKSDGFAASTNMESPFTDEIPGDYLEKGDNTVEYLLIPSGRDTSKPLGSIKLEIEVN